MSAPTIVFDLDGTLVDTAPDLVATLNVVLTGLGLSAIPYENARNFVGGGARMMIERGLGAQGRTLPAPDLDRLTAEFLDYYSAHIADRSHPFAGVEAALDDLAAAGCVLAVCSNKFASLSIPLLTALGLAGRFAAICGPDTFGISKPDPAILLATLARVGGNAAQAVMIGDSVTDIATAHAAHVPVVAVDFGYTEIPIAELGPDAVISAFSELPAAVSAVLRRSGASTGDPG
jgi:phosphoglycolate phosphatase